MHVIHAWLPQSDTSSHMPGNLRKYCFVRKNRPANSPPPTWSSPAIDPANEASTKSYPRRAAQANFQRNALEEEDGSRRAAAALTDGQRSRDDPACNIDRAAAHHRYAGQQNLYGSARPTRAPEHLRIQSRQKTRAIVTDGLRMDCEMALGSCVAMA